MNRLLFGDNLKPKRSGDAAGPFLPQWLQDTKVFPDASVDLAYLDAPTSFSAQTSPIMAPHLVEFHRVLRWTGSLQLHRDPAVSPFSEVVTSP